MNNNTKEFLKELGRQIKSKSPMQSMNNKGTGCDIKNTGKAVAVELVFPKTKG